jgi:hypothetical protein
MKILYAFLLAVTAVPVCLHAQTNTFPNTGRAGIGTLTPEYLLTVDAGSTRNGMSIISDGDNNAYSDFVNIVKDKTNIPIGRPMGWIISHRKDGWFSKSDAQGSSLEFYSVNKGGGYFAPLSFKSNGDVVLASNINAPSGNVGIGTTSPTEKLSVNGKIRAHEVKVETANWPDYVFSKGYTLTPIRDVERFIHKNGHLPEMPSAKDVETDGIDLGNMNAKLLKKIEELTLHLINLENKTEKQQKEIDALKVKP